MFEWTDPKRIARGDRKSRSIASAALLAGAALAVISAQSSQKAVAAMVVYKSAT